MPSMVASASDSFRMLVTCGDTGSGILNGTLVHKNILQLIFNNTLICGPE